MSEAQATATSTPVETSEKHYQTTPDGWIFDPETGEVIGLADTENGGIVERFEVKHEDAAEWVLNLKMIEEAKLLAIEARRAALMANLEGMTVEPRNRLKYLSFRFDAELERFARNKLEGGKGKTVKLANGTIAFRKSQGSSEIVDQSAALSYVKEWAPERIVPKPVGVGDVKAAIEAESQADQVPDVGAWFRSAEPREVCSIKTGIK